MKQTYQMTSKTSSPREVTDELATLLGTKPVKPHRDFEEEAVQYLVNELRGSLSQKMSEQNIRPGELAGRLKVNRSLITRFFRSDSDMKVSTLALFARAMGLRWIIKLVEDPVASAGQHLNQSRSSSDNWSITPSSPNCPPVVAPIHFDSREVERVNA